ncbi:gamma-glutamyltransferase [Acidobacteriia bacterium AH_259_A11_L15]|nr:gamma-glutamyltransferase [Acidobacteriia bacterium AH_259_A11_L15]
MRRLFAFLLSFSLLVPVPTAAQAPETARAQQGMVVADELFAAEAGIEILRQGGNAVDAAVAVAFALAVTHPAAGNLGGGGFMLIRLADGRAVMIDYRETAPAAARWDMFLDQEGNLVPERSTQGWLAAGVPGTLAGLDLALREYGTMTLNQVLEPAIRLADDGFPVSDRLARSLQENAETLRRDPESESIFLHDGLFYEPGELLKQKHLARTLRRIAQKGAREFYQGSITREFVEASKKGGGLFTLADFRNYRAVVRQPLRGTFHGYQVITAPPPSSGGVALLETLNMLEPLLAPEDLPSEPQTLHLVTEALRRAFADRARYLADPDFAEIPVAALVDKGYAAACRRNIDPAHASVSTELKLPNPLDFSHSPSEPAGAAALHESENTTHFSVVDAEGNAVANTYTINNSYGSGITVDGLGFLLNNEMDDFTTKPGEPNRLFGLVQSDANQIEPGKRPLSSMTPTIVVRDGETFLVLGSPGGPRIISALLEVLLHRLLFSDDLALAIARPRFHHQWLPDTLFLEEGLYTGEQIAALRALGHQVDFRETVGQINAIERDPSTGELYGVADARRGGAARGR